MFLGTRRFDTRLSLNLGMKNGPAMEADLICLSYMASLDVADAVVTSSALILNFFNLVRAKLTALVGEKIQAVLSWQI